MRRSIVKHMNYAIAGLLIGMMWPSAMPMGDTTESSEKEPLFVDLEEDQKPLAGYVIDEGTKIDLTNISFYGDTSVRGILSESSDSSIDLDLSDIKSLNVSQEPYISKRHPQKDVVLVTVVDQKNSITHEFLFPRRLIICGRDASNFGRSWYIFQINELHITGDVAPSSLPAKKTSVIKSEKIASNKKSTSKG
jgi:hypothetical protein